MPDQLSTARSELVVRRDVLPAYSDVLTRELRGVLAALAPFDRRRLELMEARIARRARRAREREAIEFLSPAATIGGTTLGTWRPARSG